MSASLLIAAGKRTPRRPTEGVEIGCGGVIQAGNTARLVTNVLSNGVMSDADLQALVLLSIEK
jgi:hypothetical protein